ncbi:MAG: metallophosphoesterase [Nanoarchaeota archaeon]|nr:metallophosphoesterase [Nanoarchaeota archaeon]
MTNRIIDIEVGKLMAVTDLHGNWQDYRRSKEQFASLNKDGNADICVFLGDIIHAYPDQEDRSKEIIDDLMALGTNKPGSPYIAVMGGHEMAPVYHMNLFKQDKDTGIPYEFSKAFEDAIKDDRQKYVDFLKDMPFAVRTAGGVLLLHAGATQIIGEDRQEAYKVTYQSFSNWDHDAMLRQLVMTAERMGEPIQTDDFNPSLGKHLEDNWTGKVLWEFFMNSNERGSQGVNYFSHIPGFLKFMGTGHPGLDMMVTGHLAVKKGVQVVCDEQLRISSSLGAVSDLDKHLLLFGASKRYENADELAKNCRWLY